MQYYIMMEDNELWDVILDVPYIPTKDLKEWDLTRVIQSPKENTMQFIERK